MPVAFPILSKRRRGHKYMPMPPINALVWTQMAADAQQLRKQQKQNRLAITFCLALTASTTFSAAAAAEPPPASRPAVPALQQLNLECVSLCQNLQGSVLRVQVPAPKWN